MTTHRGWQELGRGSHGVVFKARCRASKHFYCIKKVNLKKMTPEKKKLAKTQKRK